jgi:hypothetical protein
MMDGFDEGEDLMSHLTIPSSRWTALSRGSCLLLYLFFGTAVIAGPAESKSPSEPDATIERLLHVGGMRSQIEGVCNDIVQQLRSMIHSHSATQGQEIHARLSAIYDAPTVLRVVTDVMRRGFDRNAAIDTIAWYTSPLGIKVKDAELAVSKPGGMQSCIEYLKSGRFSTLDQPRVAVLREIAALSYAEEIALMSNTASMFAQRATLLRHNPAEAKRHGIESTALSPVEQETFRRQVSQMILPQLAFIYQPLSTEELLLFVKHLSSRAGRWNATISKEGFMKAFEQAAEEQLR